MSQKSNILGHCPKNARHRPVILNLYGIYSSLNSTGEFFNLTFTPLVAEFLNGCHCLAEQKGEYKYNREHQGWF